MLLIGNWIFHINVEYVCDYVYTSMYMDKFDLKTFERARGYLRRRRCRGMGCGKHSRSI